MHVSTWVFLKTSYEGLEVSLIVKLFKFQIKFKELKIAFVVCLLGNTLKKAMTSYIEIRSVINRDKALVKTTVILRVDVKL